MKKRKPDDWKNLAKYYWLMALVLTYIAIAHSVLDPAYYSVQADCNEFFISDTYITGGIYYPDGVTDSSGNITKIWINPNITAEQKSATNKHELCHQRQDEQGRLRGCGNKLALFLLEAECYIAENL